MNDDRSMPTVAYLANEFPSPVEPYVGEEIFELRRRGVVVVPCSVKRPTMPTTGRVSSLLDETLFVQPLRPSRLVRALLLCLKRREQLREFWSRVLQRGHEPFSLRIRTLLHTWVGAYFALQLRERSASHIHVHHGYAAAWIAMVAARLLDISYSLTLHGSDLLVHRMFLDTKLRHGRFCLTVSEYNRRFLLKQYPDMGGSKVYVQRIGVCLPAAPMASPPVRGPGSRFVLLSVGRLHPVKDHAFLVLGCAQLKRRGLKFECQIAGGGPEREALEDLIEACGLEAKVRLLGHVPHERLGPYYAAADLVVLTSRSEGIPLTLMEAMAQGKAVLAPAITGIPELVIDGKTGFLYQPGLLEDFVRKVDLIQRTASALAPIRRAAREHVRTHFHRETNLQQFSDLFLNQITEPRGSRCRENSVR